MEACSNEHAKFYLFKSFLLFGRIYRFSMFEPEVGWTVMVHWSGIGPCVCTAFQTIMMMMMTMTWSRVRLDDDGRYSDFFSSLFLSRFITQRNGWANHCLRFACGQLSLCSLAPLNSDWGADCQRSPQMTTRKKSLFSSSFPVKQRKKYI